MFYEFLETENSAQTPDYWRSWWQALPSDREVEKLAASAEWPLVRAALRPGARVLEAGCGMATWTRFLHARGYRVTGLDFEPEVIARLRERCPDIDWQVADIRRMPFPDHSFDVILCWGVVEHFQEGPDAALRELARVLTPGGTAFISVPYLNAFRRRTFRGNSNRDSVPGGSFNQIYFTADEFLERLEAAGWSASLEPIGRHIQVRFPALGRVRRRIVVRLLNRLTRWMLSAESGAHMILATARSRNTAPALDATQPNLPGAAAHVQ